MQIATAFAGVAWLCGARAAASPQMGPASADVSRWLEQANSLSMDLRNGAIALEAWQDGMAAMASEANVAEVLDAIEFERLAEATGFAELGVATSRVTLPDPHGGRLSVFLKLFAIGAGRAVIPHGHVGMASGHMVLSGEMRLRQYDRISSDDDRWVIAPTIDRVEGRGGFSTISDVRDNVHWLVAQEPSHTLDFIVAPARENDDWTVQNLDMDAAEPDGVGRLIVPTLGVEAALAKYG